MKKWLLIAAGLVVGLIVVVFIAGSLMPREHQVSREIVLEQPPEAIWSTITAYQDAPAWRQDIASVRREEGEGGTVWIEVSQNGDEIGYETAASREPEHLVRRIVGEDLPFGGTWTFRIAREGNGSRVTITEDGFVDNPIFRFVSVVVIGHTLFLDRYLEYLGQKFGETVEPVDA